MTRPTCFIVTDIEADGPDPGRHSMLSFASVAVDATGRAFAEFSVVLRPLPDLARDADTMAWWARQPQAWAAATRDAIDPAEAMRSWAAWVAGLPDVPVFVGHPVTFDGAWIDWYLQKFIGRRLFERPRQPGLSAGAGLDLSTMVMAVHGWDYRQCNSAHYPEAWFGGHHHSHCALDDARGYAHLLALLLAARAAGSEGSRP